MAAVVLACKKPLHFSLTLLTTHPRSGFKFSQLEMSKSSSHRALAATTTNALPEVVLSELVDAFQFSPSKQSVQWRMSNIVSAYVESEPDKTQLPIVVSRAP